MKIETEDKKLKEEQDLLISWRRANQIISCVSVILVIAVLPLISHNYYYDILTVKYIFYYGTIILMVIAMLITVIIFLYKDSRYYSKENYRVLKKKFSTESLRSSDWAMFAFLTSVTTSTFQSGYFYESFWGNEGRFMGMFFTLLYTVSFFVISHCLKFKQWLLDVFLATGMIVCIISTGHFLRYDPIGLKNGISPYEYPMFVPTTGNTNTYTFYATLISVIATVLFSIEKNKYKRMWYLSTVITSLFALITGMSDNAYLTLMALLDLPPSCLFNSLDGFKKYMVLVSILFSGFQSIDTINHKSPNHALEINGLLNVIVEHDRLSYFVIGLWGICIILYILKVYIKKENALNRVSNIGRWIWLCMIVLVVLVGCYILYDANIAGNMDKHGFLSEYLAINDDWGTRRGYIRRAGMESYSKFPEIHKMFGYGPDTLGVITVNNYYEEVISRYNIKFDSAHNEYLQYPITIGIVGFVAYVSLLFTPIMEMTRTLKKESVIMAIIFAVVCYEVQATVNISVPIVAPIMMTLLTVGVSVSGDINKESFYKLWFVMRDRLLVPIILMEHPVLLFFYSQ